MKFYCLLVHKSGNGAVHYSCEKLARALPARRVRNAIAQCVFVGQLQVAAQVPLEARVAYDWRPA